MNSTLLFCVVVVQPLFLEWAVVKHLNALSASVCWTECLFWLLASDETKKFGVLVLVLLVAVSS